ncbi:MULTISPECIES: hypothetical protein [Erysipelothrix]|uniref:hypothetical protein n=1 Tax=Erysipelothrix TaxID=1647 RepID=UPI00140BC451|nr:MULTISPECIES: hypothetical protein [Erysipelothrix]MDV7678450.1 hypothetical protein [Erysipelothrix rhusiopathiae]WMT70150.1 hypothetical protein K0H77_01170 [Erysipelothrix rhusiopathiae]
MYLIDLLEVVQDTDLVLLDNVFEVDVCFTSSLIDDQESSDSKFARKLAEKLEVVKVLNDVVICSFTKLYSDNIDLIRDFIKEYWNEGTHELSDDNLVYEFILETHSYLIGNTYPGIYKPLCDLLDKIVINESPKPLNAPVPKMSKL